MPDLIFISGSINSSKTTISALLAKKLEATACIHGDSLRHFVSGMPLRDAVPLTISNINAVARVFLGSGMSVIVDYPLANSEYKALVSALQPHTTAIHAFVLAPRLEVAQSIRGNRILNDCEINRIKKHYTAGLNNPGYGVVIDNSDQQPEETANIILSQLSHRRSFP